MKLTLCALATLTSTLLVVPAVAEQPGAAAANAARAAAPAAAQPAPAAKPATTPAAPARPLNGLFLPNKGSGGSSSTPTTAPSGRPINGLFIPQPQQGAPKGVNSAVWRQYQYDHSQFKLNGPNNGKPLTKLQTQQATLDKLTNHTGGTTAVVGQGSTIKQVGGEVFNGTNTPVIIKVAPTKTTLADGTKVNAYRLADGNLYYKDPTTGTPMQVPAAEPRAATPPAK